MREKSRVFRFRVITRCFGLQGKPNGVVRLSWPKKELMEKAGGNKEQTKTITRQPTNKWKEGIFGTAPG